MYLKLFAFKMQECCLQKPQGISDRTWLFLKIHLHLL